MAPADWPGTISHAHYAGWAKATELCAARGDAAAADAPVRGVGPVDDVSALPSASGSRSAFFFSMYFPEALLNSSPVSLRPLLLLVGFAIQPPARPRPLRLAAMAVLGTRSVAGRLLLQLRSHPQQTGMTGSSLRTRTWRAHARSATPTRPDDVVVHLGRGDDQYQDVYMLYFSARIASLSRSSSAVWSTSAERSAQAIE